MGTSNLYGPADEVESTATIAAAIEAGILRQPAGRPVFKVDSDEWAVTDGLFPTNGR